MSFWHVLFGFRFVSLFLDCTIAELSAAQLSAADILPQRFSEPCSECYLTSSRRSSSSSSSSSSSRPDPSSSGTVIYCMEGRCELRVHPSCAFHQPTKWQVKVLGGCRFFVVRCALSENLVWSMRMRVCDWIFLRLRWLRAACCVLFLLRSVACIRFLLTF